MRTASILIGLEMVGVTMESTHQNVTMITGTVVEITLQPHIAANVNAKIQNIRVIYQRVLSIDKKEWIWKITPFVHICLYAVTLFLYENKMV